MGLQNQRRWRTGALAIVMLAMTSGLVGCASQATAHGSDNADFAALYEQGRYYQAYEAASAVARQRDARDRDEAAYVAGLSAWRQGQLNSAERFLRQASQTRDDSLRADALANLGLLHYHTGRYETAALHLGQAARMLDGEDRAQAHFHAGVAQQRLGRWPQARTALLLARDGTRDATLRRRATEQLAVTGYAVQIGAFSEQSNARRAAEQIASRAVQLRYGSPRLVQAHGADGQGLTLVHVGTFSSFQTAHAARSRLGVERAIIVPLSNR